MGAGLYGGLVASRWLAGRMLKGAVVLAACLPAQNWSPNGMRHTPLLREGAGWGICSFPLARRTLEQGRPDRIASPAVMATQAMQGPPPPHSPGLLRRAHLDFTSLPSFFWHSLPADNFRGSASICSETNKKAKSCGGS